MKKLLSFCYIVSLFSLQSFGQSSDVDIRSVSVSLPDLEPVVVQVPGRSQSELYNLAYRWVQTSYVNPERVLMTSIENEHLRIRAANTYQQTTLGVSVIIDFYYSLEIDLKDGKYRVKYSITDMTYQGRPVINYNGAGYYKENGEVKGMHSKSAENLQKEIDVTMLSLYAAMTGVMEALADDW